MIAAAGLWSEHRRNRRAQDALAHTAYALTTRRAVVVRTRPARPAEAITLAGVQLTRGANEAPGLEDLRFQREGEPEVVFYGLADVGPVEALAKGLRASPEAIEQQIAMVAQWAEMARQWG